MAVLEKIRKRQVFLFVIIIGALLAFILGDFLNSGRSLFGDGDTVAKVGDVKVSQLDLQEKTELNRNNTGDGDLAYYNALQQALAENLFEEEFDRLGIDVTDEYISSYTLDPAHQMEISMGLVPYLSNEQLLSQLYVAGVISGVTPQGYPIFNSNKYLEAIKDPVRYKLDPQVGEVLSNAWQKMESDIATRKKMEYYNNMFMGMAQYNKADAKVYFDNQNNVATAKVASVRLNTVADDEISISDADYQAEYDKRKNKYRILDENREVAYILVDIEPTEAENAKADSLTRALVAKLKTTEGTEAVKDFPQFTVLNNEASLSQLQNPQMAGPLSVLAADTTLLQPGYVRELSQEGNLRHIAKIINKRNELDDVVVSFLDVESAEQANNLFAGKAVAEIDTIISNMAGAANINANSQNPVLMNYVQAIYQDSLINNLKNHELNKYFVMTDTVNGKVQNTAFIIKERTEMPVYELAYLKYEVYPSQKTIQDAIQKLSNYVANHPKAENFAKDGKDEYTVKYSLVTPQSFTISYPYTPDTRSLVKWAMDANKGDVSQVFSYKKTNNYGQSQDYLIAVAVMDIYNDFLPVTSNVVKEDMKALVSNSKKAQVIIDKYKGAGTTIDEFAEAIGTAPVSQTYYYDAQNLGNAAQGALAAAKKGDFIGPIQGRDAVYIIEVEDIATGDFSEADTKTRISQIPEYNPTNPMYSAANIRKPQLNMELLIGNRKVKNNTLKFTADPTAE